MDEPAIRTSGLSRSFGPVAALRDLNLCVPQGVMHGLIGPNGAGKSTTLRLLLGLLTPTAGEMRVLGRDPIREGNKVRFRTGSVLEPCGLYERQTALENLDYFGRIWHMPAADRAARAQQLLQQMGLWSRRDEVVAGWGRGLKQRLCMARSLMHRPALLLLDEPNAGLDAAAVDDNCRYLSSLAAQTGVTILMATNNLEVIESSCHSVTVLCEGRTLASGRTDQICAQGVEPCIEIDGRGLTDEVLALILRRPEVVSARRANGGVSLTLTARVDTAPLVSLLVESGVAVTEVRRCEPTLKAAVVALLQKNAAGVDAL